MIRRRNFIFAAAALLAAPRTLLAQQCRVTPRDALGPFYKPGAPAQPDLCAGGGGRNLVVTGRVLGMPACAPLGGARVEVWQADANGEYTQVGARPDDPRCLLRASLRADGDGRYAFSTILPGEYPGRPSHIHYRVSHNGYATLVTQLYFARSRGVPEPLAVVAVPDAKGVLQARFDIVLAAA